MASFFSSVSAGTDARAASIAEAHCRANNRQEAQAAR
jgi:hypothetical protein